jgi:hypothetical protein
MEVETMPSKPTYRVETIVKVEHLGFSPKGNARHRVTFKDGRTALTYTDGYVNFELQNGDNTGVPLLVEFTPAGRVRDATRVSDLVDKYTTGNNIDPDGEYGRWFLIRKSDGQEVATIRETEHGYRGELPGSIGPALPFRHSAIEWLACRLAQQS